MTQTTEGLAFTKATVWYSDDAKVTWVNISGEGAAIAVSGGERSTGEVNTFDSALPVVKGGDRASTNLTVRFVYTEEADPKPFDALQLVHHAVNPAIHVQYAPGGIPAAGEAGFWFHADGILTNLTYPGGEAGSGDPILCEFVVKCASLARSAASIDAV